MKEEEGRQGGENNGAAVGNREKDGSFQNARKEEIELVVGRNADAADNDGEYKRKQDLFVRGACGLRGAFFATQQLS